MIKKVFLFIIPILIIFSCEVEEPIPTYKLVTSVNPIEGGSVSPSSGTFDENTSVSITATPSPEYLFLGWSGSITSNGNPLSVVMNSDKSLTASFTKKQYPLTITIEGEGTVSETSENYESGAKVTLTAIPSEGWTFEEWKGDITSTENPVEITLNGPKAITVVFKKPGTFSSSSLVGQWVFNEYTGIVGGGGGVAHEGDVGGDNHEGDGGCYFHSLLLEENNTFSIYSQNYPLFGTYIPDSSSNTITFYVDNEEVGVMTNAEIDSVTNNLEGTFDFPNLFETTSDCDSNDPCSGSLDSAYNEDLTYIPEDIFEQYLIDQGWDDVLDDYFVTDNVKNVTSIYLEATDNCQQGENFICNSDEFYDFDTRFSDRMTNLSGIEAFVSLKDLKLRGNDLDSINLTKNTKLEDFYANFNSFKGVNTDYNLELINYSINDNIPDWSEGCGELNQASDSITRVSVIYNTKLKSFAPTHMSLGSIDVTNLPELTFLDVPTNNLTSLDLSNNTLLEELRAGNNFLTSIDLSTNSGVLKAIKIGDNNLTELDVTNFPLLEVFSVPGNNLTSIDLSNNPLLREISISYNTNLEGILDVSFMPNLARTEDCHNCTGEFYASGTNLECIQLSEEQLAKYEAGELERWSLGDIPYSLNCN